MRSCGLCLDPGLVVTDHFVTVPLVHGGPAGGETLEVFVRELVQPSVPPPRGSRPALLYLQGEVLKDYEVFGRPAG